MIVLFGLPNNSAWPHSHISGYESGPTLWYQEPTEEARSPRPVKSAFNLDARHNTYSDSTNRTKSTWREMPSFL